MMRGLSVCAGILLLWLAQPEARSGAGPSHPPEGGPLVPILGGFRPLVSELLFLRFHLHLDRGEHQRLLDDASSILQLWPDSDVTWTYFAELFCLDLPAALDSTANRRQWALAGLNLFDRGVEKLPDSHLLHYRRGMTLRLLLKHQPQLVVAENEEPMEVKSRILVDLERAADLVPGDAAMLKIIHEDLADQLVELLRDPSAPEDLKSSCRRRARWLLEERRLSAGAGRELMSLCR